MGGFAEGTPTATIQLDKPRELGFTLGAMRRAKELGVLNVDADDATGMMLALPEYVWACLDEADRSELTVEGIGELMNPLNMQDIAVAVGGLFRASVPIPDPNVQPAAAKKPTAGKRTSRNSGQSAATT